ncbi:MAG: ABC-type transporter, permease component, partial [Glaciihabitans sp.]|nr:ABC-type transporter, permease component [Glaciihabitans sp.]
SLLIAWIVVLLMIAWAIAPGLFTSASPYDSDPSASFAAPSLQHLFGTDRLGRDLFARTVYGTSTTLTATLIAVLVAFTLGSIVGLVSGYFGGLVDLVTMRIIDVFLSIPSLLLAMVIVSVLGYSTQNIALAVGIASIASFARVMRSEVLSVVRSDYVQAAYGLGVRRIGVVLSHVLPNSLSSVLALAALEFGTAVLAVASLGFLGYGAPPPEPEWGLLVAEGRDFVAQYPWISIIPGILIAALVISTHRVSTSLRRSHKESA